MYLIDTCVWIDVLRGAVSPADIAAITGNEPVYISPITIAQLKFGADTASDPDVRQKRQQAIVRLKRKPVLIIDEATGEIYASLAAHLREDGQAGAVAGEDVWLAAQAIQHGMKFITYSSRDLDLIPGLDVAYLPALSQ